ncbi:polysaccharide deacetylase [Streptomyces sp. DSM 44915]|uniref:Polysaccharide deacetylase n=1 Tax=Streptomyces chisholmiae TaxID=3075540 RepID=A0ABU2JV24_9ACTN|nr:polysaccharide deacetylase [Streptomyces sp. DSM 44915]MDT0268840.1 polysaccharide deacetylase [Streptomyces sp. DSM 44915]
MSAAVAWPDGARSAACLTFDLDADEVWLAEVPNAARRPGVLSQGVYGPNVAVPLLLEVLGRYGVAATFFVPGRVAERYPEAVRAVLDAGHEVAHHGYTHRAPASLTAQEEEEELARGIAVLRETHGVTVRGYRAPSWDVSVRTVELLQRYGLAYSSNLMADFRPYRHTGSDVVELPVHWTLDDAAHFWFGQTAWTRKLATNEEAGAIWRAEAAGIDRLGGLCVHTFHPQLIGRPGRLELFEDIVRAVAEAEGVWAATAAQVADWVRGGG